MNYKVGILGATGRMGIEVASLIREEYPIEGDTLEFSDAVGKSKRYTSVEGIPVRTLLEEAREPVHVWIDFSNPEGTLALLELIDTPVVICTTGFSESGLSKVHAYAEKHPVLMASNTSLGMGFMTQMLETVPVSPSLGYDVVASETHHRHKKDSPSGTLKTLLGILEKQGHRQIQVQVARAGDIRGIHTVSFISEDEEFTLTHRVYNRGVFAKGALAAAHFLVKEKRKPGLYSFQEVGRSL